MDSGYTSGYRFGYTSGYRFGYTSVTEQKLHSCCIFLFL